MRSLIYGISGRGVAMLNMLMTVYLGSRFLSIEDQGVLYALSSIAAVQVFFELGFSAVIVQFCGHEKQIISHGIIDFEKNFSENKIIAIQKICQLRKISDRWFRLGAILCLVLMSAVSYFTFADEPEFNWIFPALILMIAVSLNLTVMGRWSIYEGLGYVKEILWARLVSAMITLVLTGLLFLNGFGIFSCAATWLSSFLAYFIFVEWRGRKIWKWLKVVEQKGQNTNFHQVKIDVRKLQFRTAISCMCGFFSFQSVTIIAFKYGGPALASKVGIAMTIMLASVGVAGILIQSKMQKIFMMIVGKRFTECFELSNFLIRDCLGVIFLILIAGIICIWLVDLMNVDWLRQRLPSLVVYIFFMASAAVNQVIAVQAAVLRAFKMEPYIVYSLLIAVMVPLVSLWASNTKSPTIFAIGYFLVNLLVALPYAFNIYCRERNKILLQI